MRRKIGTLLIVLGTFSILASLALLIYGQWDAAQAEKASADLMPKLISEIEGEQTEWEKDPYDMTMPTITIDGQDYIGYLVLPTLGLELPIMADWSYEQLHTAPCRFSGTLGENDLVIMAHNYAQHFGSLHTMTVNDPVYFRDVKGNVTEYAVELVETLSATDIEKMTAGEYDLTLFTCNYSGQSRVTVRCSRV